MTETGISERFVQEHPIEALPEEVRPAFLALLQHREISRDYYLSLPSDRFDEGINQGDSPKKELVHQVANTQLRIKALITGELNWDYGDLKDRLANLSREQLLEQLGRTTEELYSAVVENPTQEVTSFGRRLSAADMVRGTLGHDTLHLGMLVKFGDHFRTPRPESMKRLYG